MHKIIWPLLLCAVLCGCGGGETGNAVQEQYRTLEQDVGRVWVQNFPEMWRLTF